MESKYNFSKIETKWQKIWKDENLFSAREKKGAKKFYLLEMFPYPSGNIHMGHVRNYSIGDVLARFKKMNGYNVLHPMGWDSFGMPAENAAIKHNTHPSVWTRSNIDHMKEQLQGLGLSYDWGREIETCQPDYYRFSQWIFLKMLEKGLAYRKKTFLNWCEECATVLANEQVSAEGTCWRCEKVVSQREMDGWFLKITDYAEDLLQGCEEIASGWPDRVLTMQKNWIGRSVGAELDFKIVGQEESINVYTTRPDTLFGATFICLAPEHPSIKNLVKNTENEKAVLEFVKRISSSDILDRSAEQTEKEGVFSGRYAVNPLNGNKIPVWVANFVLMGYGSGAIMSVPAHDQRDYEFAKKYNLPITTVIKDESSDKDRDSLDEAYTEDGIMINSGAFNGLKSSEAREKISDFLQEKNIGKRTVNYRLRDWGISRQRYWGTPIPVIHCQKCGVVPVPYENLPVRLPVDTPFPKDGRSPLGKLKSFYDADCPSCKSPAKRDTDTMDTFICSSWYFARFTSPGSTELPAVKEEADYWMPVDQYIGGIEHAVLHLLYARFFTRFLKDIDVVATHEPFKNLLTQ
ncbi:MAG: leucine--tRNA ligase, partial [Nitrospinota bacterium]